MSVRVRFAPSPTGHLHVGNVRTALYNWLFARQKAGGAFVLRVEDTDLARSEQRFEDQLLEDLRWLGLTWDEGVDVGGSFGPYRQTDRFDLYREAAERLRWEGKAYHCFCSAEELERERELQLQAGEQPRYSGRCLVLSRGDCERRLARGEEATIRLKVRPGTSRFEDLVFGPIEVDCATIGDFVLLRSDGSAQYNLACVIDDAQMQITHVIRGEGHISNTHRQLLIYEALGLRPPQFAHLSTILGSDGAKLSKRHGATSIDEFRRQGFLPEAICNYLALLGWTPEEEGREILTLAELISAFELERVNRSPAIFDSEKLNWVNRNHIRAASRTHLVELVLPFLQRAGRIDAQVDLAVREWLGDLVEAYRTYLTRGEDVVAQTDLVFQFRPGVDLKDAEVRAIMAEPGAVQVIERLHAELQREPGVTLESYKAVVARVKGETGLKGKQLFHPLRVGLTARASGPELDRLVPIFEQGSRLPLPVRVPSVMERVAAVLEQLR